MANIVLTYALIVALVTICLFPFLFVVRVGQKDFFEPIYWATAYFALLFIFRPIYDLTLGSEFLGNQPFDSATGEAFNLGLLYAFLSFCVFLIGYYSSLGTRLAAALPFLPATWHGYRVKIGTALLLALGLVAYAYLIEFFGGWSYYVNNKSETLTMAGQGYLLFGVSLISVAFSLQLTFAFQSGKKSYVTLAVLLTILFVIGFFSGSKTAFFVPVLVFLISFHYLKKVMRVRQFFGFLVLVFMLMPIFNLYRQHSDVIDLDAVREIQLADESIYQVFVRHGMSRFYGIDSLALIIRDTPRAMDFQYGSTVWPLFVAWVPRQVWENKPIISFGREFADIYMPEYFAGSGTSASPTLIGEGYLNWHLPGALFVALLSGITLRVIYFWLILRNLSAPSVFLYSQIFLYCFSFWEISIAGFLAERIPPLIVLIVVITVAGGRRTSGPHTKGAVS